MASSAPGSVAAEQEWFKLGPFAVPGNGEGTLERPDREYVFANSGAWPRCTKRKQWAERMITLSGHNEEACKKGWAITKRIILVQQMETASHATRTSPALVQPSPPQPQQPTPAMPPPMMVMQPPIPAMVSATHAHMPFFQQPNMMSMMSGINAQLQMQQTVLASMLSSLQSAPPATPVPPPPPVPPPGPDPASAQDRSAKKVKLESESVNNVKMKSESVTVKTEPAMVAATIKKEAAAANMKADGNAEDDVQVLPPTPKPPVPVLDLSTDTDDEQQAEVTATTVWGEPTNTSKKAVLTPAGSTWKKFGLYTVGWHSIGCPYNQHYTNINKLKPLLEKRLEITYRLRGIDLFMDCKYFTDRIEREDGVRHCGTYDSFIKQLAKSDHLEPWLTYLKHEIKGSQPPTPDSTFVIVFVCKAGIERSVGLGLIVHELLYRDGYTVARRNLSDGRWAGKSVCSRCSRCQDATARKGHYVNKIYNVWAAIQ